MTTALSKEELVKFRERAKNRKTKNITVNEEVIMKDFFLSEYVEDEEEKIHVDLKVSQFKNIPEEEKEEIIINKNAKKLSYSKENSKKAIMELQKFSQNNNKNKLIEPNDYFSVVITLFTGLKNDHPYLEL
jgi:hypothetical protein